MATHHVHSRLRYCSVGAHYVFFDLAAERYFMLEREVSRCFASFLRGEASPDDLRWLTERGILERDGVEYSVSAAPVQPVSSVLDDPPDQVSPLLVGEALIALYLARRRLARLPLAQLLFPSEPSAADETRARAIAISFQRTSRYIGAKDQCLLRGLALKAMLTRRRVASDLIIGVKLPFSAHCWVQSGSVVLSDPLDHVASYKPLLVVS